MNTSNKQVLDGQEYEQKIDALKKDYKYASLLTKQDFYIPLLKDNKQLMYCYSDENEKTISLNPNSIDELKLFKKIFLSRVQV